MKLETKYEFYFEGQIFANQLNFKSAFSDTFHYINSIFLFTFENQFIYLLGSLIRSEFILFYFCFAQFRFAKMYFYHRVIRFFNI